MQNNKEDRAVFAKVMWGVAGNFGGKISNDDLSLRFEVLKEFSIDQITKAGTWLLRNREQTFPAVPTTKEFIDAIKNADGPSTRLKADIEADKVLETLKEWGRDAEALFHDEITRYLMTKRWTFRKLDLMAVDDPGLKWWRKEFVLAYQDIEKDKAQGCNTLCIGNGNEDLKSIANCSVKSLPE